MDEDPKDELLATPALAVGSTLISHNPAVPGKFLPGFVTRSMEQAKLVADLLNCYEEPSPTMTPWTIEEIPSESYVPLLMSLPMQQSLELCSTVQPQEVNTYELGHMVFTTHGRVELNLGVALKLASS